MPEYGAKLKYVGHCWFCETAWEITCHLHGKWGTGNCPLDGIGPKKKWHNCHNERKEGQKLAEWDKVEMDNPKPEVCRPWVEKVLDRPELNCDVFNEFFEDVKKLAPTVLSEHARFCEHVRFRELVHLCWTAHLVADYACLYWSTAKKCKPGEKYRWFEKKDKEDMGIFVKEVGGPILDCRFPRRQELGSIIVG